MDYYYSPFRKGYNKEANKECPFCNLEIVQTQGIKSRAGKLVENEHYFWTVSWFPRMEGQTMVVPKRHLLKLEDETEQEVLARHELVCKAAEALKKIYPGAGIEIFLQTGEGSASTVSHLHWHVVPALPGSQIKGIEKLGRFTAKEEGEERLVLFPIPIKLAREGLQKALAEAL
ncbi:MAG: HIT domain-containing protein [Patescibacteria group bacterium]|nr:HIT domain-containing protein [Patescibacteria group bacterium]